MAQHGGDASTLESGQASGTGLALAVVLGGSGLLAMTPIALVPALPAMAAHFAADGNGALIAQLTLSLPAIMIIIGGPVGALASERFGLRASLLWALILYTLSGAAGLVAPDLATLIGSRLILGLMAGAISALVLAVAAGFPGAARERAFGLFSAAGSAAGMIVLAIGGRLVDFGGWRLPFAFYFLGLLVFAGAWFSIKSSQSIAKRPTANHVSVLNLWPLYALLLVFAVAIFLPSTQGPFLLSAAGLKSATDQSTVLAFVSGSAMLTSASYGFLRRYINYRMAVGLGVIFLGGGIAVLAVLHGFIALAAACCVVGLGSGLMPPAMKSVIIGQAVPAARARAAGVLMSIYFLGQFLAPLASTPLRNAYGVQAPFLIIGAIVAASGILVGLFGFPKVATSRRAPPGRLYPASALDPSPSE